MRMPRLFCKAVMSAIMLLVEPSRNINWYIQYHKFWKVSTRNPDSVHHIYLKDTITASLSGTVTVALPSSLIVTGSFSFP